MQGKKMIKTDNFIDLELNKAEQESRQRHLLNIRRYGDGTILYNDKKLVDFCSNDYLGLSFHPALKKAGIDMLKDAGCGSGASRLMSGNHSIHEELEAEVASNKHKEDAILAGSGYLMNTGIIPALMGRGDAVFSDRLNHASIFDGIRLSGARMIRYRHNDMKHLRDMLKDKRSDYRQALIVTESLFSMDGDIAPLSELVSLSEEFETLLIVDEAHAVGVFGRDGEGLVSDDIASGIDLIVGTFGKSYGGYGAFAALDRKLKRYMLNKCRTVIFSTSLSPSVTAINLTGIRTARKEDKRRKILFENGRLFRKVFSDMSGCALPGDSQIIPVVVGKNNKALELEQELFDNGIFARAIRPPTVPEGTARIRFSVTAMHNSKDVEKAAEIAGYWIRNL